jgi:hypothetical protein
MAEDQLAVAAQGVREDDGFKTGEKQTQRTAAMVEPLVPDICAV